MNHLRSHKHKYTHAQYLWQYGLNNKLVGPSRHYNDHFRNWNQAVCLLNFPSWFDLWGANLSGWRCESVRCIDVYSAKDCLIKSYYQTARLLTEYRYCDSFVAKAGVLISFFFLGSTQQGQLWLVTSVLGILSTIVLCWPCVMSVTVCVTEFCSWQFSFDVYIFRGAYI